MTPRAVLHSIPQLSPPPRPTRQPRVEIPSTRQREPSPPPTPSNIPTPATPATAPTPATPATAIRIPVTPAPLRKEISQDQTPVRPQQESPERGPQGAPSQPPHTPGLGNQPIDHSTPPSHAEEEETPRPRQTATRQRQRPQPRPGEDLQVPEVIKDIVAPAEEERQSREINNPPRELLRMVLQNLGANNNFNPEGEPRTSPGPDLGEDLEHFADVAFVAMTTHQVSVWKTYPVRKMVWTYSFAYAPFLEGAEIVKVFLGSWNYFAQAEKGSHVADYNQAVTYRVCFPPHSLQYVRD